LRYFPNWLPRGRQRQRYVDSRRQAELEAVSLHSLPTAISTLRHRQRSVQPTPRPARPSFSCPDLLSHFVMRKKNVVAEEICFRLDANDASVIHPCHGVSETEDAIVVSDHDHGALWSHCFSR